jgi:putative nucleotidyltransferase with HDIG domain
MPESYSPFDDILEGCQVIASDWRYLYVNAAAARQGRRTRQELLGATMTAVYPGIADTPLFSTLRRCMESRRGETLENEFTYPDGNTGWFELRIQPVPAGLFILSIDVTARVEAERTMARQLARLRSLREIDLAILGTTDVRVALRVVLQEAMTQPHVTAAALFLTDASQTLLSQSASLGPVGDIVPLALRVGDGPIGQAAAERRRVEAYHSDVPAAWRAAGIGGLCASPLIARGRVIGVLVAATPDGVTPDAACLDFLEALGGQAAMAIDAGRAFEDLQRANTALALAYDTTLEGWAKALDLRDRDTVHHTLRVTDLTLQLARRAGVPDEELVHIRRGALLHDIGKMGVPDTILHKPGPLADDEWVVMRRHPDNAYQLLSPIAYLRPALDIPYCHHERWDGTGYPRGLEGEAIPLPARLFAVVDVWDALSSDRPYRPAWPRERVVAYLEEHAGSHFDPRTVGLFITMLAEQPAGS